MSYRGNNSISFETDVDIDISEILYALTLEDIISWIKNYSTSLRKEELRRILNFTIEETAPLPVSTLQDELKYEALCEIWQHITLEDINKLKQTYDKLHRTS